MSKWDGKLRKLDAYRWEISPDYKPGMKVPGIVYASDAMMESIKEDQSLEQVANVAFLPGIMKYSLAMPDIHWGYGFPIGGVAATRVSDGVVSPGGVGYDINCGVRLLKTNLTEEEVRPRIRDLINHIFNNVPSGLGSEGKIVVSEKDLKHLMAEGAHWAVKKGYGQKGDLDATEEMGCMRDADPDAVSSKAIKRGMPQSGTLGSGNHFLEIQTVKEIFDQAAAEAMGIIAPGQVLILIHTGSRGLGHQVCGDYLRIMETAAIKYSIRLPDKQLACAPIQSDEGKKYLSAMACAANYAWANRQCIAHWIRESFAAIFHKSLESLGMDQVYDVAHNIAKIETHHVDGKAVSVCVHRKGATRAFPPHHEDVPEKYKDIGQPVLIPGDMGRVSYIALGSEKALAETFGSTCHGAGRMQSRGAAKRSQRGSDVAHDLEARGITIKTGDMSALAEEASEAYKDITQVIEVAHQSGISKKVVMTAPIGVIKG